MRDRQTSEGDFTMRRQPASEVVDQERQLLGTAAIGIAAAGAASFFPRRLAEPVDSRLAIRPASRERVAKV
jgi:hypothetical protein